MRVMITLRRRPRESSISGISSIMDITVTPISRPVVKMQRKFFWQRQLPTSFIGRFQLLRSYRARFFG